MISASEAAFSSSWCQQSMGTMRPQREPMRSRTRLRRVVRSCRPVQHRGERRCAMKGLLAVQFFLLFIPFAQAADVAAGKAKVASVCAACHGAEGVSVSDAIPNLAAQRAAYLEAQLKALKDGSRKNPIMNAIAGQLAPDEIANVAAYFSSLPGAPPGGAKSAFLPNLAKTHVTF